MIHVGSLRPFGFSIYEIKIDWQFINLKWSMTFTYKRHHQMTSESERER